MIGVTAAASAGVYLHRGLHRSRARACRWCSACLPERRSARVCSHVCTSSRCACSSRSIMIALAIEMLYQGLTKRI